MFDILLERKEVGNPRDVLSCSDPVSTPLLPTELRPLISTEEGRGEGLEEI